MMTAIDAVCWTTAPLGKERHWPGHWIRVLDAECLLCVRNLGHG